MRNPLIKLTFTFPIWSLLLLAGLLYSCEKAEKKYIPTSINKGCKFLLSIQQPDGAIADTIDPLFDIWETVLATTALAECDEKTHNEAIARAMKFLHDNEDSLGLICHNRKCKAQYCLETSAEYFLLKSRMRDASPSQETFDTVIAMQNTSGTWEIGNPDVREVKDFPSVSAFVMEMLRAYEKGPRYGAEALYSLVTSQKAEGHWGIAWEYYQCPAYALWPVMRALAPFDSSLAGSTRKKAEAYILSTQLSDGSWNYKDSMRSKMPSPELQTALMLSALLYTDTKKNHDAISKGVDYLLTRQREDGSWDGGYFPAETKRQPKAEYVFATSRALCVLQEWNSRETAR